MHDNQTLSEKMYEVLRLVFFFIPLPCVSRFLIQKRILCERPLKFLKRELIFCAIPVGSV